MFQWLKNFLEWREGEVKNISGLADYISRNWFKLAILTIVIIVIIYIITKLIKMLKSLL